MENSEHRFFTEVVLMFYQPQVNETEQAEISLSEPNLTICLAGEEIN
jgi:hypothetical protein